MRPYLWMTIAVNAFTRPWGHCDDHAVFGNITIRKGNGLRHHPPDEDQRPQQVPEHTPHPIIVSRQDTLPLPLEAYPHPSLTTLLASARFTPITQHSTLNTIPCPLPLVSFPCRQSRHVACHVTTEATPARLTAMSSSQSSPVCLTSKTFWDTNLISSRGLAKPARAS